MRLKEHVISYFDEITFQAIGAVSTFCFEYDKVKGFNTDEIGALNPIQKVCAVKDKHIIILGTGGATKAIASKLFKGEQR